MRVLRRARTRVALVLAVAAVVGAALVTAGPAAATEQTQNREAAFLVSIGSLYGDGSQCVEATGAHNGAHVRVWTCDNSSEQNWWRYPDGAMESDRYRGQCMDADLNGGGANGTYVQTWACNLSSQQQWLTRPDDLAIYNGRFLNGYNTVLDRNVNWVGNGAPVQLWQKNFQPQQWWAMF